MAGFVDSVVQWGRFGRSVPWETSVGEESLLATEAVLFTLTGSGGYSGGRHIEAYVACIRRALTGASAARYRRATRLKSKQLGLS
jgi:hypothetical protein